MDLITGIIIAWGVGFTGYMVLFRANRYNNLNFYDVRKKVQKYKSIQKRMNESINNK
jgi:uncharacterized protein (DUF486 family)